MIKELVVDRYVDLYTYFKPLIEIPSRNKYAGLSLDNITARYGSNEADWVYFMATQGIDLTKHDFKPNQSDLVVKLEYNRFGMEHEVAILNKEGERRTLFKLFIDGQLEQNIEVALDRELRYHLKQIGVMGVK